MPMTYEAEQQIVKALRSLPWYMFLVPAWLSLLMALFAPAILADTRSEYGYWAVMWIVAKLGFFVWVLRQLLRYAIFNWAQKFRKAVNSHAQANHTISRDHNLRPPFTNVTIISRRTIPRHERRPMWR
jgi:hypothetical protein